MARLGGALRKTSDACASFDDGLCERLVCRHPTIHIGAAYHDHFHRFQSGPLLAVSGLGRSLLPAVAHLSTEANR